jgi:hypothetical protein
MLVSHDRLRCQTLRDIADQCTRNLDVADAYDEIESDRQFLHVPGHGAIYCSDGSVKYGTFPRSLSAIHFNGP